MADGLRGAHNESEWSGGGRLEDRSSGLATTVLTDDVVAAAAAGDGAAMRTVYLALAPRVNGYLRAKGVADHEAVTNDVFLALLPKLSSVTGGAEGLQRLVFTIAHARMADEHRARAHRPEPAEYKPHEDTRTSESAEEEAGVRLATARVVEVLDALPGDQREVLMLRIVADLSLAQVADVIGRSTGAVKQLQRRALITVREVLSERGVTL